MQHHTVFRKTNRSSKVSNVGRFKTFIEDIRYLLIHESNQMWTMKNNSEERLKTQHDKSL